LNTAQKKALYNKLTISICSNTIEIQHKLTHLGINNTLLLQHHALDHYFETIGANIIQFSHYSQDNETIIFSSNSTACRQEVALENCKAIKNWVLSKNQLVDDNQQSSLLHILVIAINPVHGSV
jgi:hypothetical protein